MKKTAKFLVLILIFIFIFCISIAYCDERSICFVGYYHSKEISLKFVFNENDNNATVQYHGQKDKIVLTFLQSDILNKVEDRPSYGQSEWEEVYNGKKTGRYIMASQGAVIYHFAYIRYSDMKVFFFERDPYQW